MAGHPRQERCGRLTRTALRAAVSATALIGATHTFPLVAQAAGGTTYYVDQGLAGASDTNSGTSLSSSFRTISECAAVAVAGDTCLVRAGTYRETVAPAASGTSGSPITFKNYNSEKVTISGANLVTGSWSVDSGATYKATATLPLGDGDQVFVDGTMVDLAQWPNDPDQSDMFNLFYATVDQGTDTAGLSSLTDQAIGNKPTDWFKGGTIWWLGDNKWTSIGTTVTGSSGNTISYTSPTGWEADYDNPGHFTDGKTQYVVSGVKNLLDTADEWWFGSNTLYLQLPGGASPASHTVEYKARQVGFDYNAKNWITVQGIDVKAAAVKMSGDDGVWDGGNITYGWHHDNRGAASAFPGGQGSYGTVMTGSRNVLRNSTIRYSAGQGVTIVGDDDTVDNDYVYDTDYRATYDGAVQVNGTALRARITRNTIARTGAVCVAAGDNDNGGHLITYNDCSRTQLLGDDRGGIQAKGADVGYNVVHDIGIGLARQVTPAFYTDTSGDNVTYHHNIAYDIAHDGVFRVNDTGNPANGNTDIKVYDNTGYDVANPFVNRNNTSSTIDERNSLVNPDASTFVNAAGHDFRLAAGAAAIDAGTTVAPYTDGYAGSAPDKGAYEYGGSPAVSGWTAGVGSTAYYTGATTSGTSGTPLDTNLLTDPGFESGTDYGQTIPGWSSDGDVDADYTEVFGGTHSGTYKLTQYKQASYSVYTSQTVTGLTNGSYRATAWVRSSGGQTYCLFDAKNFDATGTDNRASISGAISTWTQVSVDLEVTNGQATVGFYSLGGAGQWLYADDVSLVRLS